MRMVILLMSISLDGHVEGPIREIDWHLVGDELFRHFIELLAPMGGFLEDGSPTSWWPVSGRAR